MLHRTAYLRQQLIPYSEVPVEYENDIIKARKNLFAKFCHSDFFLQNSTKRKVFPPQNKCLCIIKENEKNLEVLFTVLLFLKYTETFKREREEERKNVMMGSNFGH